MANTDLASHAEHFLRVASQYPYVTGFGTIDIADDEVTLSIDLAVELPNASLADGKSPTGVKATECVEVVLHPGYPQKCPTLRLRHNFPNDLPHLTAGDEVRRPQPCLIDGSPDEFFAQNDLLEANIFALLDQLGLWLKRAAIGVLADEISGWEPINRNNTLSQIVSDRDFIINDKMRRTASGNIWLGAMYTKRLFEIENTDNLGLWVTNDIAPKVGALKPFPFARETRDKFGSTVVAILWSEAEEARDQILPENVSTIKQLEERAASYGLGAQLSQFFRDLDIRFRGKPSFKPIPVGVILCVRRPFKVTGRNSEIELVPYWFDISRSSGTTSSLIQHENPVFPARQIDMPSRDLFRHVSGSSELPSMSFIGCGSVGSKLALHFARSGAHILAVTDSALLNPHNMARHALARPPYPFWKARELADEIKRLFTGNAPKANCKNVILALSTAKDRRVVVPPDTELLINTTASRLVREAIVSAEAKGISATAAEVALFGRGNGAFVFHEGAAGNPSLVQLEATMYASTTNLERELLFDPIGGLARVQIGDGCGSQTMIMSDARLSAMTAMAAEELTWMALSAPTRSGYISVGSTSGRDGLTTWRRMEVSPFERVPIEGSDWNLDLSSDVIQQIKNDVAEHSPLETGGLLIGTCNSRMRSITVVDVLPAPPDSQRTANYFVLGTSGLKRSVERRHEGSGGSLFDVGTWHSHPADQGASTLDWQTAADLAASRPPPAVLLICTPKRFLAISGNKAR